MKRISFVTVCNLLILSMVLSCTKNHHNVNLTVSESEQYFIIRAHYPENHQYDIDKCMDKHFGKASNMSFTNTRIKGDISMDNGTKFFIEKKPGFLDIEFNKDENSAISYKEVKAFSNDLKSAMQ